MTSNEIREQFLKFFANKEHKIVDSSPVVPFNDPTLLFINAGMNQFKDVFLGTGTRDYKRAVNTQKCIRVSGKHNDLEEVGHDTYHHTFFEMLGNWSFGDYYKEDAIKWAWELLTEVWKLPKERLWATVYRTDDEAFDIWEKNTDINPSHILRFDEKDNFWEMGDTGPCGPCSEIHINLTDDIENASLVNAGRPDCIELWNLVFIQYNRDEEGKLHELPSKHVDTGMGFERMCAVLQDKTSNYDTDVFTPLIKSIEEISGHSYKHEHQIAMRVISDHIRTLTFAIADGAVPGNEGRSYVLRRLLRRASRYARKLDLEKPFMFQLVDVVADNMGEVFPEIVKHKEHIKKIIKAEEESFNVTLDRGIELFNDELVSIIKNILKQNFSKEFRISTLQKQSGDHLIRIDKIVGSEEVNHTQILLSQWDLKSTKKYLGDSELLISGDTAFKLYDTFGFPLDLTMVMAKEKGFSVDEKRFDELMREQKDRARKATKTKQGNSGAIKRIDENTEPTMFLGYDTLESEAEIISAEDGYLVVDRSPFYAESGGQVGDTGIAEIGDKRIKITDTQKIGNVIVHKYDGSLDAAPGSKVMLKVDEKRRRDIMRNHSATHLLHAALRKVLGDHVQQKGSFVGPEYLRFDFTHFEKMTHNEIDEVESIVNEKILESLQKMHHRDTPFEEAKKMGAMMFFGDKYGDKVNVVQFGDFTLEFCGGTHVNNTSEIGLFKIISESSIASGIRRIEAVTGRGVEEYIRKQENRIHKSEVRINELLEEKKKLEKELSRLQLEEKLGGIDQIISDSEEVNGINIFKGKVEVAGIDELKSLGDELRNKMKSGVGLLIAQIEDKVQMVCVVSDDLVKEKKVLAGKIVGEAAKIVGGGGGGRPHMATAGGKDVDKIDEALKVFPEIIKNL
ncbi:MAG: alanine--tRNA ligase [Melioribacteraceae bacterium]|nr:alanine--tRNA ligase [Melioribacteraceae bacterium]